ncbi:RecQ type DNA helicase Hrq1 [Schizosaccharomyces cryophilus OY26]|uniref:RecQ type DNA helicase Hrq1 n=1 Tax=Schizosaccharomyces cryophilus (strain OY26 / ATCC MYA-4695 / CBS 11777 / NBRC 106824 / NRRL Y48691) TaxID=653667 RepID=S9VUH6_SCHCR|nr:RecQ type DNA helicase Hrq1 [Schizosaccharomyces cryophilus OY26]EPY51438.1 RecQ type DNA helicase Hrq1 [Schizosaccharomyces cryophilus OY26]
MIYKLFASSNLHRFLNFPLELNWLIALDMVDTPVKQENDDLCLHEIKNESGVSFSKPQKTRKPSKKRSHEVELESTRLSPALQTLFGVFKIINTTYTFLYSRNCLTTTFSLLNSSVRQSLKRDLSVLELSQLKIIVPDLIELDYKSFDSLAMEMNKNVYADIPKQIYSDDQSFQGSSYVLTVCLNQTVESSIKRQKREGPTMKSRIQKGKFDINALKKEIDSRNTIFLKHLQEFINSCGAKSLDPDKHLIQEAEKTIPSPPDVIVNPPSKIGMDHEQKAPSSIEDVLVSLTEESTYEGQIVQESLYQYPAVEPRFGTLKRNLSQSLVNALFSSRNIERMYTHQADAINALWENLHVIVSTGTSSGKSLIYQIPILDELEKDIESSAFFVFPTKALAQDQKRSLMDVLSFMPSLAHIRIDTFDGDTPIEARNEIIENASIIFTNPDMLHQTILPNHHRWNRFFKNLKLFVLDEAHIYNGIFGVHVAMIMRRLRRIAEYYGNDRYRFVSCSATIEQPARHMNMIFGVENVKLVNYTTSPSGAKHFLMWNPPLVDKKNIQSGRKPAIAEAANLLIYLAERKVRTIVFCRIRKACESLMRLVRGQLKASHKEYLLEKIQSYRAGYTVEERRKIEKEMFCGNLYGIVATNALELGIDIGSLDAAITVGFPCSLSNLRQQFGRAGRRNKSSLAIYVVETFPVDQYYLQHPMLIHTQPNAELTLDLDNEVLIASHLQCAAFELPINEMSDSRFFEGNLSEACSTHLVKKENNLFFPHPKCLPFPAVQVQIRNINEDMYTLVDVTNNRNVVLEQLEPFRVMLSAYEGAVYVYQGKTFIVKTLNIPRRLITCNRVDVEWSTLQRDYTDIDPQRNLSRKTLQSANINVFHGTVSVALHVFGYFKVNKQRDILDVVDIVDNPVEMISRGFWIDVPWHIVEILSWKKINGAASIHAAQHALMSLMPIFAANGGNDIRTECKSGEKEFKQEASERRRPSRLIFYDNCGECGGADLCKKAYKHIDELTIMAIDRLEHCGCKIREGCPQCITSIQFEGGICSGEVLDKDGALILLKMLVGQNVNLDLFPDGPEIDEYHALRTLIPT